MNETSDLKCRKGQDCRIPNINEDIVEKQRARTLYTRSNLKETEHEEDTPRQQQVPKNENDRATKHKKLHPTTKQ